MRRFFYDTEFIEEPSTIDLISIGLVSEDGQSRFYAQNEECNFDVANDWVKENVIAHLIKGVESIWKTREEIARGLIEFLQPSKEDPIELWGYYADYDHVALCWLFGPMVALPKGMPMYTRDFKQLIDMFGNPKLPTFAKKEHVAIEDAEELRLRWHWFWQGDWVQRVTERMFLLEAAKMLNVEAF